MREIHIEAGRRQGKSTMLVDLATGMLKNKAGTRILVLTDSGYEGEVLFNYFKETKLFKNKAIRSVTSPHKSIRFKNGSQIDFLYHTSKAVKGRQVDCVMIDNVDSLKPKYLQDLKDIFYPCTDTIITTMTKEESV